MITYRFNDTILPLNKRYRESLAKVHGVGLQKSSYISDFLGLGLSFKTKYLNKYYYEMTVAILKNMYIVDYRLRNLIRQRLEYFLELRLRKGTRLFKGLSVHGQRTHTNCKTSKKNKPIIPKKFESILNILKPVIFNVKKKDKFKDNEKNNKKNNKKK